MPNVAMQANPASAPHSAVNVIGSLKEDEIGPFLKRQIARQALTPMMRELNADMLSHQPSRRAAAEAALARIGFL